VAKAVPTRAIKTTASRNFVILSSIEPMKFTKKMKTKRKEERKMLK